MLYKFLVVVLAPIIRVIFRIKIVNKEVIKKNTGYVLAGNHITGYDPIIVGLSTTRIIHFISKDSLNKGIFKYIFKALYTIPVDRENKTNDEAIKKAINLVKNEKLVGIFPEGTRNKTDKDLLDFKVGAAKIAFESNKEIIPFFISGTLFRKGRVVFGEPIKPSSNLEETTNKLKEEVLKLKEI